MRIKNLLYALPAVALMGVSASPATAQVFLNSPMAFGDQCCPMPVVSTPLVGCGFNAGTCGFGSTLGGLPIGAGLGPVGGFTPVAGVMLGAGTGLFSGWHDVGNAFGYRRGYMSAPGFVATPGLNWF